MINLLRYSNEKKKLTQRSESVNCECVNLFSVHLGPSGFSGHSLKRSSAFSIQFSEHDVVIVSRLINNIPER